MTLEEFYSIAVANPPFDLGHNPVGFPERGGSEQSAHLPLLRFLASQCEHVTEFGLREGYTTAALTLGLANQNCKLVSYDISVHPIHKLFNSIDWPCHWQFVLKDIVSPGWQIEETDFLFVDDLHTYKQVKAELAQHGGQVRKYLAFHDTYSQGAVSLDVERETGIKPAIDEYTAAHGWKLVYKVNFNHGLEVYAR